METNSKILNDSLRDNQYYGKMQVVQDQRNSTLHCNQEKSVTDFWDREMWLL
jgi:hypothetical protein